MPAALVQLFDPMIQWYHAIISAYGFWLPNDPRGSWSEFVGSWELFKFGGPATTTNELRSPAHDPHDVASRRETKGHLKYPPVRFTERQRQAIGRGFKRACDESEIAIHACCIGHDHCHIVSARHAKSVELVVGQLKGRATQQMKTESCHPLAGFVVSGGNIPSPWSERCWKVFIEHTDQLEIAIEYVERHPEKEGMARQNWDFVVRP